MSIWLRHWPTDRWRRQVDPDRHLRDPLVLVEAGQGGLRLVAVDARAAAEGLVPGVTLGDARAVVPYLHSALADAAADAAALKRLAGWALRYAPLSAIDGADGLLLDISGAAHLFGPSEAEGERALLEDCLARLHRMGITAQAAIADTPAAAWAWARFGAAGDPVIPPGGTLDRLAPLRLTALRLDSALIEALSQSGIRRIGELAALPRAPLAARFGSLPRHRLDQALGRAAEPITPVQPPLPWSERLALAEPISRREDIELAAQRLLERLCRRLEQKGQGARRLTLTFHRVDGTRQELAIGTGRAAQDAAHLLRLFRQNFDQVEPGFGIELVMLAAPETGRVEGTQAALQGGAAAHGQSLDRLYDTLRVRLGDRQVRRLVASDSHDPLRAQRFAAADAEGSDWTAGAPRPVQSFSPPLPIEVTADGAQFRWRGEDHRLVQMHGPERIAGEWWRSAAPPRDHYRVEDSDGKRFWIWRQVQGPQSLGSPQQRWFLQGLLA